MHEQSPTLRSAAQANSFGYADRNDSQPYLSMWAFRAHALLFVSLSLVQVLIWWNATPDLFFWPIYSIIGWGVWVGFHAWMVLGARRRSRPGHH